MSEQLSSGRLTWKKREHTGQFSEKKCARKNLLSRKNIILVKQTDIFVKAMHSKVTCLCLVFLRCAINGTRYLNVTGILMKEGIFMLQGILM